MSTFKVKNGLSLTPIDPSDIPNPVAGDIIADATDNNKIKRWDASSASWKAISSSASNDNLLINPGFEDGNSEGWTLETTGAAVSSFTIDSSSTRPKHFGEMSGVVTCDGSAGAGTCVFYQDVDTGGSFDYMHSIWANADASGKVKALYRKNLNWSTGDGNELNVERDSWKQYTFQRVSGSTHAGIGIEITVGAGEIVKVTLDEAVVGYNDPVSEIDAIGEWETFAPSWTNLSPGTNPIMSGKVRRVGDSAEFMVAVELGAGGEVTGRIELDIPTTYTIDHDKLNDAGTSYSTGYAQIGVAYSYLAATATPYIGSVLTVGETQKVAIYAHGSGPNWDATKPFDWTTASQLQMKFTVPIKGWSSKSKVISTGAELFSTDTHTLSFKSTAITASDPVGTYNTYSYAKDSNDKTICGTAPTTAPTKADGFKIFTRAYNAASSCNGPARVEIKIAEAGTSLPSLQVQLYKNDASSVPRITGSLAPLHEIPAQYGAYVSHYDESTGIFILDAGWANGSSTSRSFLYDDITVATSGYLVINAQPAKTTQAMSLKEFDYVYVKASNVSGQSVPQASETTITGWTEQEDTHNSFNPTSGTFVAPADGVYKFSANALFDSSAWVSGSEATIQLRINGSSKFQSYKFSNAAGTYYNSVNMGVEARLNKGDAVTIGIYQTSGSAKSLQVGAVNNWLTITRIPGQFK